MEEPPDNWCDKTETRTRWAGSLLTSGCQWAVSAQSPLLDYAARARPNTSHLRAPARRDGNLMSDYPQVTDLVTHARNGERQAWDALVERYAPLIWSICRRHGLG